MAGHQILAGIFFGWLIRLFYGVRYTDMAAFRAIRRATLFRLGMREMTYGWNLEMQMRAATPICASWKFQSTIAAALAGSRK